MLQCRLAPKDLFKLKKKRPKNLSSVVQGLPKCDNIVTTRGHGENVLKVWLTQSSLGLLRPLISSYSNLHMKLENVSECFS